MENGGAYPLLSLLVQLVERWKECPHRWKNWRRSARTAKQSACVNSLGIVENHSSRASGPLVTANDVTGGGPYPSHEDDQRDSAIDGHSGPWENSPIKGRNHAGNSSESQEGRE